MLKGFIITLFKIVLPTILIGLLLHIGSNVVVKLLHDPIGKLLHDPSEGVFEQRIPPEKQNRLLLSHIPIFHRIPRPAAFKIYIYDMPPTFNQDILSDNKKCGVSMFASEVALHMWLLNSDLRTLDPNKADFFYVPAYTTCRYTPFAGNGPDPWAGKELMKKAILWIHKHFPDRWKKKNGSDHIFTATHDYGSCFDFQRARANKIGPLQELSNSVVLMSLGDSESPCYNAKKDIVIPSFVLNRNAIASGKEVDSKSDLMQANWKMYLGDQGPEDFEDADDKGMNEFMNLPPASRAATRGSRRIWIFFWGKLSFQDANGFVDPKFSHGIRQNLVKFHKNDPTFVLHHVGRNGAGALKIEHYHSMLDRSIFCLAPAAYSPWTQRLYEVAIHGCIPVIIADSLIMPFESQINWKAFSVRVSEADVAAGKLKQRLNDLGWDKVQELQSNLAVIKNAFVYKWPSFEIERTTWKRQAGAGNAFDYIMRELSGKLSFVDH
jgi:hypothetical protein